MPKPPFVRSGVSNGAPSMSPEPQAPGPIHDTPASGPDLGSALGTPVAVPGGSPTRITGRPDQSASEPMPGGSEPTLPPRNGRR